MWQIYGNMVLKFYRKAELLVENVKGNYLYNDYTKPVGTPRIIYLATLAPVPQHTATE